VDAVAPGAGAHQQHHVADLGGRRRGDVVGPDQPHAHGVHQGVLGVGLVETDLAGHVGHADAVAVPGDAAHNAVEQVPVLRVVQRAEPEGVEQGYGAGAHGQDVPDDAAHARGCSLQRLHGGRMVMGLDLENYCQAIADIHRAGVLRPGLGQDSVGLLAEQLQQRPGVLVAAVFAPERPEHPQFDRVGLPVQPFDDQVILGPRKRDLVQCFFGHRHLLFNPCLSLI